MPVEATTRPATRRGGWSGGEKYIPEAKIILFGCRPHVPYVEDWHDRPAPDGHFHAPELAAAPPPRPFPTAICRTCGGLIGTERRHFKDILPVELGGEPERRYIDPCDSVTYCETCSASAPWIDAACLSAWLGLEGKDAGERLAEQNLAALESFAKKQKRACLHLTESERRRIWNGYKGNLLRERLNLDVTAKEGRDFLERTNQKPDWDLVLDQRGLVRARVEDDGSVTWLRHDGRTLVLDAGCDLPRRRLPERVRTVVQHAIEVIRDRKARERADALQMAV